MSQTDKEPLRGDAKWRATRQEIADRNEAATARSREQRASRDAQAADRRRAQEKADSKNTPTQPGRS
jgi:hypothetical protein